MEQTKLSGTEGVSEVFVVVVVVVDVVVVVVVVVVSIKNSKQHAMRGEISLKND